MERKLNHWEIKTLNKFLYTLGRKKCSKCGDEKPLDEFSPNNSGFFMNIFPYCKECQVKAVFKCQVKDISNSYVRGLSATNLRKQGFEAYSKDIPDEIIESYRETLKLKREIKSKINESKESKKSGELSPKRKRCCSSNINKPGQQSGIAAKIAANRSPLFKHSAKRNVKYSAKQREAER